MEIEISSRIKHFLIKCFGSYMCAIAIVTCARHGEIVILLLVFTYAVVWLSVFLLLCKEAVYENRDKALLRIVKAGKEEIIPLSALTEVKFSQFTGLITLVQKDTQKILGDPIITTFTPGKGFKESLLAQMLPVGKFDPQYVMAMTMRQHVFSILYFVFLMLFVFFIPADMWTLFVTVSGVLTILLTERFFGVLRRG